MLETSPNPAAGYKFNNMQEIKSHSSILYNERLAILFYLLDMRAIDMNTNYQVSDIMYVRALLRQIYKNMRMLIRFNPVARASLHLETKDNGVYIPDVVLGVIDGMIDYCEVHGYTSRRIYIIARELDKFEILIKDVLQYYNYFIRPDFRQKPDVDVATEQYMEIADLRTVEELRAIAGRSHHIDFDNLGSKRVELQEPAEDEDDGDGIYGDEPDYIDGINEKASHTHFDEDSVQE